MSGPTTIAASDDILGSRVPWVAPPAAADKMTPPTRLLGAKMQRRRAAPWPQLPEVSPMPPLAPTSAPPPLMRSSSHPVRGALPFALPGPSPLPAPPHVVHSSTFVPQLGRPMPHSTAQASPHRQAWIARLFVAVPAGVVPALGALPGLWGGVRQLGAARAWQDLLLAHRARCWADGVATGGASSGAAGPTRRCGIEPVTSLSVGALNGELAALSHAISETRFRMASLAIELTGICTTALPQLLALLRPASAATAAGLLRAAFPYCLLAHGILGFGHAVSNIWVLRRLFLTASPKQGAQNACSPWLQRCANLQQEALRYHVVHGLLWLAFVGALAPIVWGLPMQVWGTALLGVTLGGSVAGLLFHHACRAERYDAPRALWLRPPWRHVVFADPEACEAGYELLLRHDRELQDGLAALLVPLSPLRRTLLTALFGLTSVQLTRTVFVACARRWLSGQHDQVERVTERLMRRHEADFAKLWTAQAWRLDKQLHQRAQDGDPNGQLGARQLTARVASCAQAADLMRRAAAEAPAGMQVPAAQRLLAHKSDNDELLQAVAWAGRWRSIES